MKRPRMEDSSTEMVVQRVKEDNFGFAFNEFNFSDRILRLEILPDEDYSIDSDKKLRRQKYHQWFSSIDADHSRDGAKVVTLHMNSAILALKSPFFYKLFTNGMSESQQKNDVSLRINASEEACLMDLLKFMYENTLGATSVHDLVDVLIAADKFEVTSCMKYSIEMLLKLPMSLEDAVSYLELPSSVLTSEIVKPLIDEAKIFIVAHYKDFTNYREEAMELPITALEVVLGSEGLQVDSEDDVFDFILKWACAHYPDLEERREILTERLARLVCFPNMSSSKLKEVLVCPDFDHEQLSKLVMEALFSKVEFFGAHHINLSKDLATAACGISGRAYSPRCVVYFDLKKEECAQLFPYQHLNSVQFALGGKRLYLRAQCSNKGEEHQLGLFVERVQGSETCTLDCEFAVMNKLSKKFQSKGKANSVYFETHGWGMRNLFGMPWTEFMSDDCEYFIDGILHLRAEITLLDKSKPLAVNAF